MAATKGQIKERKNGDKPDRSGNGSLTRKAYDRELARLHGELVKLQQWVVAKPSARRAEIARAVEKFIEVTPRGWADHGAGVCRPPPPVVQERRERAVKARRNRRGFCAPSAPSRHGDNARYPIRAFCSGARRYEGGYAIRACYLTPKN